MVVVDVVVFGGVARTHMVMARDEEVHPPALTESKEPSGGLD
ncbi:MAG: hypothetical protein OXD31_10615 [Chloroflexi bacterium]|nr:hypothetical protein [Chloroflexota bacterium]